MQRYANLSGHAGVVAYAIGPDSIEIRFRHGGTYRYTHAKPGRVQVEAMKRLARAGRGLTTYISQSVRDAYESRRE